MVYYTIDNFNIYLKLIIIESLIYRDFVIDPDSASFPVMMLTFLAMIAGIVIPFTSFGRSVDLTALPPFYFVWLAGILISYCFLTQVVKKWYIKKFNSWL